MEKAAAKVFTETFFSGKGQKAEVKITVDLNKKVTDYYLHIAVPFLEVTEKSNSCRMVGRGFPFDKISTWRTHIEDKEGKVTEGKTYCQWLIDLTDSGALIPTDREKNGGVSNKIIRTRHLREYLRS